MVSTVMWILIVVGFLALGLGIYAFYKVRSRRRKTRVIEIRQTPRRAVEEMTVNEYRELGEQYLEARGFRITDVSGDPPMVTREDKQYLFHYDPAAEAGDPRSINQLIVRQRKEGLDGVVLITSAELSQQSKGLAERSGLEVLDPDRLIGWQRKQNQETDP